MPVFATLSSRATLARLGRISLPAVEAFNGELSESLQRLAYLLRKQETEDNSQFFHELDSDAISQRLRDFENLHFRLGQEEADEMRRGRDLSVLAPPR